MSSQDSQSSYQQHFSLVSRKLLQPECQACSHHVRYLGPQSQPSALLASFDVDDAGTVDGIRNRFGISYTVVARSGFSHLICVQADTH